MLKAAQIVMEEKIGVPILLGNRDTITELKEEIGFDAEVEIIDPKTDEEKALFVAEFEKLLTKSDKAHIIGHVWTEFPKSNVAKQITFHKDYQELMNEKQFKLGFCLTNN